MMIVCKNARTTKWILIIYVYNNMMMYWIRWIIFLWIIIISVFVWWYVYTTLFQLIAFHISVYEYILQGQDFVWSVWSKAQETLREWFWSPETQSLIQGKEEIQATLEERIATYTQKVRIVCGLIGFFIATRIYSFLTRNIFKIKEHWGAVKKFIYG